MKIIRQSIKILILVLVVCLIYKLNMIEILICMSAAIVFQLFYFKEERIRRNHKKQFADVVLYMEQLIYSFKKQPKIRPALLDAQKVCSPVMKELIEEVVVNIDTKMSDNIYEESLKIIQQEYNCKRLKSLHKFIVKIEKNGGNYENYIEILLEDIKEWKDRTSFFIKDVERVKRNVLISMLSTVVTCGFMVYLIPDGYGYSSHIVYQISTMFMIILLLGAYVLVIRKLNFSWIKDETFLSEGLIIKYYSLVERGYDNIKKLKISERLVYKKAKKRLEAEIFKQFPDWIRSVAINLQNDTVQSSIESSYDDAEFILKRPIRKLLIDFEKYPIGIEPYDNLLKEFDLSDIKSSMKMFYSMNELGKEQSDKQINAIIERNNKLLWQAEDMKNKDRIGLCGMFTVIPMLVGVVKIMTDMILMIIVFTTSISKMI